MIMYTTLKILSRKPDTNTLHSKKWRLEKKLKLLLLNNNIIHTDLEYTGLPDSLRMKMCFFLSLHSAVCVSSSSSSGSSWGLSDTFSISLLAYWNLMNKHVNIAHNNLQYLVQQEMTYLGYQINESFQVTCWSLFVHLSFLHSMFMTTFMSV